MSILVSISLLYIQYITPIALLTLLLLPLPCVAVFCAVMWLGSAGKTHVGCSEWEHNSREKYKRPVDSFHVYKWKTLQVAICVGRLLATVATPPIYTNKGIKHRFKKKRTLKKKVGEEGLSETQTSSRVQSNRQTILLEYFSIFYNIFSYELWCIC